MVTGGEGDDLLGGIGKPACGPDDDLLYGFDPARLLPDDCERVELHSFRSSRPTMLDGHPGLDLTRREENRVSCRVHVEIRTFGGRLLARGAKRTDNRETRATAVLTSAGRSVLRDREDPVRVVVTFRRASCRGDYGSAGEFRAWL